MNVKTKEYLQEITSSQFYLFKKIEDNSLLINKTCDRVFIHEVLLTKEIFRLASV